MKPAFALDLRDETIRLLHRSGGGWQLVGAVDISAPDLTEALGYLRATALGLSPRGIATKLILPNDQILYTTVAAPGPEAAKRRKQVAAALEGKTPYAVADLTYDFSGKGETVAVAVIARETLAEAEAFAAEHRFNPVSFVAVPEEGSFAGEPWFGASALSKSLLAEGEKVERDAEPVQVVQRSFAAAAPVEPAPEPVLPEPEPAPEPEPEMIPAAPEALPEAPPEYLPAAEPAAEPEDLPEPEAQPAPLRERPDPAAPEIPFDPAPELPDDPETAPEDLPPELAASVPPVAEAMPRGRRGEERLNALAATLAAPIPQPLRPPPAPVAPPPVVEVEEAPMALDVPSEPEADLPPARPPIDPGKARVTDPAIEDDLPPMPAPAMIAAFSSRRQPGEAVTAAPAATRPVAAKPVPAPAPAARPPVKAPVQKPVVGPAKGIRGLGALVTAPGIAGAKPRGKVAIPSALPPLPATDPNAAAATTTAAAARPAVKKPSPGFGAKPAPVRGKPRFLGLILTVVLLFLLAMIAAWSSYSLTFWKGSDPATVETVTADPAPADAGADVPDIADEMAADMQDPADLAAADAAPDPAGAAEPDPAALTVTAAPTVATDAGAGSAAQATPGTDLQNEIFLATADPPPVAPDPLALPEAEARGDPLPAAQAAPPPFGTVYQFDAEGRIQPTPEGIITPEGVLLVAGRPPRVPEARPAALTAAPAEAAPLAEATAVETAAPYADPALAGKQPKPRPEGLQPAAAPADQGALAPASDSRFAGFRPMPRPAALLVAAPVQDASLATSADGSGEISVLAVAISRRPAPRPDAISQATAAALAEAAKAAEPAPEPEKVAAAAPPPAEPEPAAEPDKPTAPEADNEPEAENADPKIPTKAAVAKQATYKNAINLSTINLIGVYGTPANRYAMVRLSSGSYKKIKVGDRIDGGKVAAITSDEVRYQKGGKLVTLDMPRD